VVRKMMVTLALSGMGVLVVTLPAAVAGATQHKSHHKPSHHKSHTPKAAAAGTLSGTWSGHYSGAFHGTFSLIWQQSGSTLGGTIKLSTPPVSLKINGTVAGNAIHFGTVGGVGVTYTGSVDGNGTSMSGTYQAGGGGGSWSATKSS
jgi:hypothetical protein